MQDTSSKEDVSLIAMCLLIAAHHSWCSADGHLRLLSLEQLCKCNGPPSDPIKKSYVPLNGYIIGFQIVTNPRTNDKYFAGGADDGSVAFWSMKYVDILIHDTSKSGINLFDLVFIAVWKSVVVGYCSIRL
jgi:hypothetical protein